MREGARPLKMPALALGVSLLSLLSVYLLTGISLGDILIVGTSFFLLSAGANLLRIGFQGLRLKMLVSRLGGVRISLSEGLLARASSELVSLTLPAFVGGEAFRGLWLYRVIGNSGVAAWIAYVELLFDIMSVMLLALFAAFLALYRGAVGVGSLTLLVATASLLFYGGLLLSIRRKTRRPLQFLKFLVRVLLRRRGEKLSATLEGFWEDFLAASTQAGTSSPRRALLPASILTFAQALLQGFTLWILLTGAGMGADLISSTLAAHASLALASLPISPGGSGVAEGSLLLFLAEVFGLRAAGVVIAWRIATYHVSLLFAGISALIFTPRVFGAKARVTRGGTATGIGG